MLVWGESEFFNALWEHWPGIGLFAVMLFGLLLCIRFLALASEEVAKALGPVGVFFRNRRAISQAEFDDMRRRIVNLDKRVKALTMRDECYFSFMLADAEWHRRHELLAAAKGWEFEPHVPFLVFRERWARERGIDEDVDIWT